MILPDPPKSYNQKDEAQFRNEVRRADRTNRKIGQDIELVGERIILTASDGSQWVLSVDTSGVLSTVAA